MADTLTDLRKEAKQHWTDQQWGKYRNGRYEAAEHMREEGDRERALHLYVEVMIFDLQGVTSGSGEQGFSQAHFGETPAVAREMARLCLKETISEGDLELIYTDVVDEFWVEEFPRSEDEVWEELTGIVETYQQEVQFREKVEALGPDELLSPSEADAFAKLADDYELLRRIGTLLEDDPPTDIPWEKRKQAHTYLSAVDIDAIGDIWRGRAFRWAGEIVLSNNEPEAALEYYEKALEDIGRDDHFAVQKMVNALRQELGREE